MARSYITPQEFARIGRGVPARRAAVPVPAGEQRVRQTFLDMERRVRRLRGSALPFSAEEFHAWVRFHLPKGIGRCAYCSALLSTADFIVDHAQPLSRGGDVGLGNLATSCSGCNTEKGELTADEFLSLRAWMEDWPEGAIDVCKRLRTGAMGTRLRWHGKRGAE